MALEKYKICPACGEHNAPNLLECRKCETDLTGIKIVDATAVQAASATQEKTTGTDCAEALFRVCDCGEMNPPQARKCQSCGEDISDILPAYAADQSLLSPPSVPAIIIVAKACPMELRRYSSLVPKKRGSLARCRIWEACPRAWVIS